MARLFNFTKIAFWLGLVLFVVMITVVVNQGAKNYELQKRADKVEAEIASLENDKQQLSYKILYYKTDNYKEKLAREKLGLQLPGESVVIMPASQQTNEKVDPVAKISGTIPTPTNFEQWLDFLFGS